MRNHFIEDDLGTIDELDEFRRRRRGVRRIPYDYVIKFPLTGNPGNRVSNTVNISAEAWFICAAIGYSLEEPLRPAPAPAAPVTAPGSSLPPVLLRNVNLREFLNTLPVGTAAANLPVALTAEQLIVQRLQSLRESLSFTYALVDKGSGRELQNEPIHNLAGLGKPDGTRPFRELASPYVFAPNTSLLVEIKEINTILNGIIHMCFQGYKEFR